jgi:hypothetical protein
MIIDELRLLGLASGHSKSAEQYIPSAQISHVLCFRLGRLSVLVREHELQDVGGHSLRDPDLRLGLSNCKI